MSNAFPRRFQLLAAMNAARERGDLDAFYRLRDEHLAELTGAAHRGDAAEQPAAQPAQPAEGGESIDWGKVASEVGIMLALNPQDQRAEEPEEA